MTMTKEGAFAQENPNVPQITINTQNVIEKPRQRIVTKPRLIGAAAIAAAAGIASIFWPTGGKVTTEVKKPQVTYVGPANVDERAVVVSRVGASTRYAPQEDVIDRDFIDHIPFIGSANKWIDTKFDNSEGETVTLTGAKGKGNAKVYTLVGLSPKDDEPVTSPNGNITYYVNTDGIRLVTGFYENDTMTIDDNGNLLQFGETIGGFIPGTEGIKRSDLVRTGTLEQDARELAANTEQKSCVSAAWPLAKMAITSALKNDAVGDYKLEVKTEHNLLPVTKKDVSVVFVGGTPSSAEPYPHLSSDGYTFSHNINSACTVVPDALQLNGDITAVNGGPLPSLNG